VELLEPLKLHEARHTCVSLMIAAGCDAKALSTIMTHATITMTALTAAPGKGERCPLVSSRSERRNQLSVGRPPGGCARDPEEPEAQCRPPDLRVGCAM
jgi:hypothetical protein